MAYWGKLLHYSRLAIDFPLHSPFQISRALHRHGSSRTPVYRIPEAAVEGGQVRVGDESPNWEIVGNAFMTFLPSCKTVGLLCDPEDVLMLFRYTEKPPENAFFPSTPLRVSAQATAYTENSSFSYTRRPTRGCPKYVCFAPGSGRSRRLCCMSANDPKRSWWLSVHKHPGRSTGRGFAVQATTCPQRVK